MFLSREERIKDISKIFNGRLETVSTNNHVSIENEGKSNSVVILERSIQQFLLDSKDYVRTTVPYYVFKDEFNANGSTLYVPRTHLEHVPIPIASVN